MGHDLNTFFYSSVPSSQTLWYASVSLILEQWSHVSKEKQLCLSTALSQETILSLDFAQIRRYF